MEPRRDFDLLALLNPTGNSDDDEAYRPDETLQHLPVASAFSLSTILCDEDSIPLLLEPSSPQSVKRRRHTTQQPQVERLDFTVCTVPMEKRQFKTWEAFEAELRAYSTRTYQLFSVTTATPVMKRNRVLERQLQHKLRAKHLIPERFVHYSKTLKCTHGGRSRRRSKGERLRQTYRAIDCPAKITLSVQSSGDEGKWAICVTNQVCEHNHAVNEQAFALYPENRRITDPRVLEIVREMHLHGTPREGIRAFLEKKTGIKFSLKAVQNHLARVQLNKY